MSRKTVFSCDICGKEFRETGQQRKQDQYNEDNYLRRTSEVVHTVNRTILFQISWNWDLCDGCLLKYAPVTDQVKRIWK